MRGLKRAIVPGTYPTSKHWTTQSQWDILPNGHKAKGVSIFDLTWGDYTVGPNTTWPASHLADMWSTWPWTTWIKPQIDMAVQTFGCNYIRFFATSYGRNPASGYASILSDQAYFYQWKQLLDYCRSLGIYCYPTLEVDSDASAGRTWFGYSPNNAWRVPEWQHLARLFQAYLDVVMGIDMINEAYGWATTTSDTSYGNPGGNTYNAVIVYDALKSVLPQVPLTISTYFKNQPNQTNPWSSNSGGQRLPIQGVLDFYDCHIYYDAAQTDFDVVFTQGNQAVLIGEFGADVSTGTASRQSRYNSVAAVLSHTNAAGAAAWNMWDSQTQTSQSLFRFGLADSSGNIRTDVESIFQAFPS